MFAGTHQLFAGMPIEVYRPVVTVSISEQGKYRKKILVFLLHAQFQLSFPVLSATRKAFESWRQ
jgi:hypothetical protein